MLTLDPTQTKQKFAPRFVYPLMGKLAHRNAKHVAKKDIALTGRVAGSCHMAWSDGAYPVVRWPNGDVLAVSRDGRFLYLSGELALEAKVTGAGALEHLKSVYFK